MFYLILNNLERRSSLISFLKANEINSVFHYQSLNKSEYYLNNFSNINNSSLIFSDFYSDNLVRLPLFFDLSFE